MNTLSPTPSMPAAGLCSIQRMVGRCLDLYCCEGGAGMGYALAGWKVTGVDIKPQPRYPQTFVLGDALEYLEAHGSEYDLIHASPPCQGYSHLTPGSHRDKHARMIPAVRALLQRIGKPYVIENVAGARHELRNPVMLCGSMFGLRTRRHRYFETNFQVTAPRPCDHSTLPLLVTTASKSSREKRYALGMKPKTVKNAPLAYGIGWMSCDGLKEAIPPAYTQYIGTCAACTHASMAQVVETVPTCIIRTPGGPPAKGVRESLKGHGFHWNPDDMRGDRNYPVNAWLLHRVPAPELPTYQKFATDLKMEFDYFPR